jgi:hypothetical protein
LLVVAAAITNAQGRTATVKALVDTGCSGMACLIHQDFLQGLSCGETLTKPRSYALAVPGADPTVARKGLRLRVAFPDGFGNETRALSWTCFANSLPLTFDMIISYGTLASWGFSVNPTRNCLEAMVGSMCYQVPHANDGNVFNNDAASQERRAPPSLRRWRLAACLGPDQSLPADPKPAGASPSPTLAAVAPPTPRTGLVRGARRPNPHDGAVLPGPSPHQRDVTSRPPTTPGPTTAPR